MKQILSLDTHTHNQYLVFLAYFNIQNLLVYLQNVIRMIIYLIRYNLP